MPGVTLSRMGKTETPAATWALRWLDGTTEPLRFLHPDVVVPYPLSERLALPRHDGCGGLVTFNLDGSPVRCRACPRWPVSGCEVTVLGWQAAEVAAAGQPA